MFGGPEAGPLAGEWQLRMLLAQGGRVVSFRGLWSVLGFGVIGFADS